MFLNWRCLSGDEASACEAHETDEGRFGQLPTVEADEGEGGRPAQGHGQWKVVECKVIVVSGIQSIRESMCSIYVN